MVERMDRFWVGVAATLLVITIAGIITFLLLRPPEGDVLVLNQPEAHRYGQAYVGGAVVTPGLYPLAAGDTIEALIAAAGGTTPGAGQQQIRLLVPNSGETTSPQKVDLNRAEAWLLEAVPGIGPTTAKAIVEHRTLYGPFRMARDLLNVPGIGETTFQRLNDYVTVGE